MKKHELWEYFDQIQLSEEDRETVLRWALHPEEGETPVKKVFAATRLLAAALIVCLITATVCVAASVFRWDEKFFDLFQPTQSQMEALQGATSQPQASVTQNGVTVTVRQTLADQHGIYVLYDVEGPQGVTFPDELCWEYDRLHATRQEGSTYRFVWVSAPRVVSREGNKCTVLRYEGSNGVLENQELNLHLENLGYYETIDTGDEEAPRYVFHTVLEGTWSLTWKFNYENLTQIVQVNQPVTLAHGEEVTLLSVEISPISLWVNVEGIDGVAGTSKLTGLYPQITFRDGSSVTLDPADERGNHLFAAYRENEGGIHSFSYQFDSITDISEIASITLGSLTVPIK